MPVRIRNGASSVVQRLDHLELAHQPFGVEAVGDGEARAVVGERQVLVAELGGGLGHLGDGAAAVGPVRMAVAVPPQQRRAARRPRPVSVGVRLLLEVHEVGGRLARHRLGDDPGRGVAHAGEVGEPARRGALGQHARGRSRPRVAAARRKARTL